MIAVLCILSLAVMVLLPIVLVQWNVIGELEAKLEAALTERDQARQAATDWMEIAERCADKPRPRRVARWGQYGDN